MQIGDKVTKDNYKRGYKVKRSDTWKYPEQDRDSIYGVILNKPEGSYLRDEEVKVLWIDQHNHPLKTYNYVVGRDEQFDLVYAEETVDYSLDDMFADLDALALKFEE